MNSTRLSVIVALAACLAACSSPPPPAEPVKPLRFVKVGAGGTALGHEYSGEVRARIETTLAFQVGGRIAERQANVGDSVRAGQVLARLDPKDVKLANDQAESQHALALAEAQRFRDLRRKSFVSQAVVDAKETALAAAEAQLALARNQSRYTSLIADRAGVISQVLAEPGQVIAAGAPVFRMAAEGDREIALAVPESDYAQIRVGKAAQVALYAQPGKVFKGTVRELSPSADPATRTYAVRIALPGQGRLPTGMTATVRFDGGTGQKYIAIPLTAVYQQGDKAAVWVIDSEETVSLLTVEIASYRDDIALVKSGLQGGERIAAAGVNRLHAGQKIRPVAPDAAAAETK